MTGTSRTEGERWVRDELAELREASFSPRAVGRFLVRSQRRADATRAARPDLARQEAAWLGTGALGYLALAVRPRSAPRPGPAGAAAWWVACGLMLDWHLGMVETPDGRLRRLGAADALTLARAWLVPVVAARPRASLVAGGWATDVADGAVARRGATTRAGRDLEGLVDLAFATAVLRGLVREDRLPRRVARAEAARLAAGTAALLGAALGGVRRPEDLARAGRAPAALRVAGMLLAARGRERAGAATLAGGTALSVALATRRVTARVAATRA